MQRIYILTLFLLHSTFFVHAQEDWKLKMDKEGIQIYSRNSGDSRINSLRVSCILEATLSQITAVLLNIKSQDEWFYHTKSKVLLDVSPSELYYYAELYFPFPFSDRDFVEHVNLSQDPITKIITMNVQNVPDYISSKKNYVRVLQSSCKWVIRPSGKEHINIEFTLFADPAGSIPIWLVNRFAMYGPFETFKKLKIFIKKPEYVNVSFPFIKNF